MDNLNINNRISIIYIYKKENESFLKKMGLYNIQLNYSPTNFDMNTISNLDSRENNNILGNNILQAIKQYKNIKNAIDYLKKLRFNKTIIFVNGNCFESFLKELHNNLKDIYVIPIIIQVLTTGEKVYKIPKENKEYEKFYTYGGTETSYDKIIKFIEEILNENECNFLIDSHQINSKPIIEEKLIFEQIKNKKDLVLPMFNRILIEPSDKKDNIDFIQYMRKKYIEKDNYKILLNQMINIPDIPVELLSKYYARMYTVSGDFYEKMKQDLLSNDDQKFGIYHPYIKTLYDGLEKGALKTNNNTELYSAQLLSKQQIEELKYYEKNKMQGLPMSIVFSKSFISFSKEKKVAEDFYKQYKKNTMLTLVKDEKELNLNTHIDIEELSCYNEKDVLFFPFSAFGIDSFSIDQINQRYNLKLIYLGKYIKDFENDKALNISKDKLPNTNFKFLFKDSGLVKKNKINNFNDMQINEIAKEYKIYKESKNKKCNKYFWFLLLLAPLSLLLLLLLKNHHASPSPTPTPSPLVCQGGFYLDNITSTCLKCKPGYYSNKGATFCPKCPDGHSSYNKSTTCFGCQAGTYSNSSTESCFPCKEGWYSKENSSSCIICSEGYFSNSSGSSECSKCPKGYFSNIKGAISCKICPAGTASNNDSTECDQCKPGFYSSISGSSECIECPNGTYSESIASTNCIRCPGGKITNNFKTSCVNCPNGTYSEEGAQSCTECPPGKIPNYDKTSCINCTAGYYSNISGANEYIKCPNGTYSEEGAKSCTECPPGKYQIMTKHLVLIVQQVIIQIFQEQMNVLNVQMIHIQKKVLNHVLNVFLEKYQIIIKHLVLIVQQVIIQILQEL